MSETNERDYVLGTHDAERARLGLQHRVWRPRVLDLWRRAGLTEGMSVADLGCGPGFATLDLAEIVGPSGHVTAVDRSRRFLGALEASAAARGLSQVSVVEADLSDAAIALPAVDRAWMRWVLCFLADPAAVLAHAVRALKPGGALMLHDYFDYAAWSLAPRSAPFDAFVAAVIESWRAAGGDSDVGRRLPRLLAEAGLAIEVMEPVIHFVRPRDYMWRWPAAFVESALDRLTATGAFNAADADAVRTELTAREADPQALMLTPVVIEIVARKPG